MCELANEFLLFSTTKMDLFKNFTGTITKNSTYDFTTLELQKLDQFRERVEHIYPEPNEKLIAWLRARDLDLDKAEKMLHRHLIWRKHNEIDKLLDWKSIKVYFPYILLDFDYEGTPVFLLPFGHWDLRSCIENGDILPALKFIYQCLEICTSTGNEIGIYQGTVIIDFDSFSYMQLAHRTVIQGIIETLRIFEANYPEVLKHAFVINAPKIFNILFAIVKPILHSRTLSKIQIYNSDRTKWLDGLSKVLSLEILPKHWGGTRPGSDEFCSDSWFQEPLPKYYMRRTTSIFDEYGEEWFTIKIHAKECLTFEYLIENEQAKLNTILRWGFYTEGYDIGFAIVYEDDSKFLVEHKRVDSHVNKQFGSVQLDKSGTYVLQFDNSFSKSRAKNLHYFLYLETFEVAGGILANNANGKDGGPNKNLQQQRRKSSVGKKCSIGHVELDVDEDFAALLHAGTTNGAAEAPVEQKR